MTATLSDHDELVAQLRGHIPAIQGIADRAYAAAGGTVSLGVRRDMERAGNRAADLVIALASLKSD